MYSVYTCTCTCIYMYNISITGVSQSAPHLQSYSSYRVFHITYGTYGLICASFHAFIFHFDFHVLNKKANQCLYTSMGLTIIVQHSRVHSPSCCAFWLVFHTKSTMTQYTDFRPRVVYLSSVSPVICCTFMIMSSIWS
jgi:hypothetical protein